MPCTLLQSEISIEMKLQYLHSADLVLVSCASKRYLSELIDARWPRPLTERGNENGRQHLGGKRGTYLRCIILGMVKKDQLLRIKAH